MLTHMRIVRPLHVAEVGEVENYESYSCYEEQKDYDVV